VIENMKYLTFIAVLFSFFGITTEVGYAQDGQIIIEIDTRRIIEKPRVEINDAEVVTSNLGHKKYSTTIPIVERQYSDIDLIVPIKRTIYADAYDVTLSNKIINNKAANTPVILRYEIPNEAITNMFNCENVGRYIAPNFSPSGALEVYIYWKYVYENCPELGAMKNSTKVKEVALNNWFEAHKMLRSDNPGRYTVDKDLVGLLNTKYCTYPENYGIGSFINLVEYFASDLSLAQYQNWSKFKNQDYEVRKNFVSNLLGMYEQFYSFDTAKTIPDKKKEACSIIKKHVNGHPIAADINSNLNGSVVNYQRYKDLIQISKTLIPLP